MTGENEKFDATTRPPRRSPLFWFMWGLISGWMFSMVIYCIAGSIRGPIASQGTLVSLVLGIKLMVIVVFFLIESISRHLYLGVLASIPAAALGYLCMCAAQFI